MSETSTRAPDAHGQEDLARQLAEWQARAALDRGDVSAMPEDLRREGWRRRKDHLAIAYVCDLGAVTESLISVGDGPLMRRWTVTRFGCRPEVRDHALDAMRAIWTMRQNHAWRTQ